MAMELRDMANELKMVMQESKLRQTQGDAAGAAGLLLSAVALQADDGALEQALATAGEAEMLFKEASDNGGQAAALHLSSQLLLSDSRIRLALEAATQAVMHAQNAGDREREVGLQMLLSQGNMQLHASGAESNTLESWNAARQAVVAGQKAVKVAKQMEDLALQGAALCTLSQAFRVYGVDKATHEAVTTAEQAVTIYRSLGDKRNEAYALVMSANGLVAQGALQKGWEAASKGLYIFREMGDEQGQLLALQAIYAVDDILDPPDKELGGSLAAALQAAGGRDESAAGKAQVSAAVSGERMAEIGDKVRVVVQDLLGMETLEGDTPLMNMGLTSQSAVLLRNSLTKSLPGSNLPFTLMFDRPSIKSLNDYFVERELAAR